MVDSKTHARRRRAAAIACASILCLAATALAQREFGDFGRGRLQIQKNIPYDGRFTFVRISYETAPGGYWAGGRPSWSHGYPLAEQNLMKIMNELSYLGAHDEEINTLTLDDPALARYPVAYIIEVGWWTLSDREAAALRAYILKGGFVIVDDFKTPGWRGIEGGGWEPFAENMKRVLPEARFVEMQATHPIFHAFFEINALDNFPQAYNSGQPIFRRLRRQRPEQASAGDRELQHRHLPVLGVVRPGIQAVRSDE